MHMPDRETVASVVLVLAAIALVGVVFALDLPTFVPPRVA